MLDLVTSIHLLLVICRNCGVLGSEIVCLTYDSHASTGHTKYLKAIVGVNSFLAQLTNLSTDKSFLLLYMGVMRDCSQPPLPLDMQ